MRITQKRNKITPALIASAAVLLVAGGYFAYAYTTKNIWPFAGESQTSEADSKDGINYSPPTEDEIESGQDAKKDNYDSGEETSQQGGKTSVSVGIAFAGFDPDENAIDVRAFTPDVIESDGTCTATFTQGALTVSESSKAFVDFSSSQCKPILIPQNRFSAGGTWKLVVTYASSKSTGTSPTMDVEVTQ